MVNQLDQKQQALLTKWGVQDFAEELRFEPPDKLRALFHHESGGRVHLQKLLFNLVWQAYSWIKSGKRPPVDGNERSFWYSDVKLPLSRLGLLQDSSSEVKGDWKNTLPKKSLFTTLRKISFEDLHLKEFAFGYDGAKVKPSSSQYLYNAMTNVFYDFVSNGIFRFHDFGFNDDFAPYRCLGKKHPNVIFFAEKIGFVRFVQEIFQLFDCGSVCLGGEPKLLSSEYFVRELSEITSLSGHFKLLACVDYDPFGKIIAEEFQRQLSFFGLKNTSLKILVDERLFTDEDLERYQYPLPINNQRMKTIVEKWVKETGGVKGKPFGIQCDFASKDKIKAEVEAEIRKG